LTLSSVALAAGAMNMTISIPRIAAGAAQAAAAIQFAGRLALHVLPAPRAGAEFSAAALLAVVLFLTITLPDTHPIRPIGAKS
jgi:hypothetical protein